MRVRGEGVEGEVEGEGWGWGGAESVWYCEGAVSAQEHLLVKPGCLAWLALVLGKGHWLRGVKVIR